MERRRLFYYVACGDYFGGFIHPLPKKVKVNKDAGYNFKRHNMTQSQLPLLLFLIKEHNILNSEKEK